MKRLLVIIVFLLAPILGFSQQPSKSPKREQHWTYDVTIIKDQKGKVVKVEKKVFSKGTPGGSILIRWFETGSLIFDGTYLYGTTVNGGPLQSCIVFKIKPNGTGFMDILDFNVTNGDFPQGSLVSDGTFLYGTSSAGGTSCSGGGCGTVFKLKPDGTGFDTLIDFNLTNGASPRGDLYYDGTYLYGMTYEGGANGYGIIFKIKPDGSGYVDLYDFKPVPDGGNPNGSLLLDGGCLYGMTLNGGINNLGSAFKYCLSGAGINQFESNNNQINVYPNPTSDQFFIETNTNDKLNVDLYDVNGRHVFNASRQLVLRNATGFACKTL